MASSGKRRTAGGPPVSATVAVDGAAAPAAQAIEGVGAPPRVGEQIARLRASRRMTLDELSRAAGVSKSMLSEIERDRANPTIAVAWRLTNALGVGLDYLFAQPKTPDAIAVSSPNEIPMLSGPDREYQLRVWGPIDLAGKFEWYELVLQAGGALASDAHEPGTREHLTVLHGSVQIEVAGTARRLKVADTARYDADGPHVIRNAGRSEARALLVVVHL